MDCWPFKGQDMILLPLHIHLSWPILEWGHDLWPHSRALVRGWPKQRDIANQSGLCRRICARWTSAPWPSVSSITTSDHKLQCGTIGPLCMLSFSVKDSECCWNSYRTSYLSSMHSMTAVWSAARQLSFVHEFKNGRLPNEWNSWSRMKTRIILSSICSACITPHFYVVRFQEPWLLPLHCILIVMDITKNLLRSFV